MLILYWCLVALMVLGVIGAFIPGIPGTSVLLVAIGIWGLVAGFQSILWPLISAIVVLLFCIGVDLLAGYLGAKQAGASKWGQIGAIVGMVVAFLGLLPIPVGGLIGLMIGPFIGAIVGEFLHCKDWKQAIKAGTGIVVGSFIGNLIQGIVTIVPLVVFLMSTWNQGWH